MCLTEISSQWWLPFFSAIAGALVGGVCTYLGSFGLSEQQRKNELKNVAKAIDIDLERIYKWNWSWYILFKDKNVLLEFDQKNTELKKRTFPITELYNPDGIYFIFNHDIAMFGYELSSQIYTFYRLLLEAESARQYVNKNEDVQDSEIQGFVNLYYANMKSLIVSTEEQIPKIREQLKYVYGC